MPHSIKLTSYGAILKLVDNITVESLENLQNQLDEICKILKDDNEAFGTLIDITEAGIAPPVVIPKLAETQRKLFSCGSRRLAIVYDTAAQIVDAHLLMGKHAPVEKRYICTDIYDDPFDRAISWLENGNEP